MDLADLAKGQEALDHRALADDGQQEALVIVGPQLAKEWWVFCWKG